MVEKQEKFYIPEQGDAVWVKFNPQAGHEQAGIRPALILSPAVYNSKTSLALMCPITSKIKGYPFEVILPNSLKITGAILSDQIKSLDWKARKTKFITRVPLDIMNEVVARIKTLIFVQ